jgi:signal transduction histidine kinase
MSRWYHKRAFWQKSEDLYMPKQLGCTGAAPRIKPLFTGSDRLYRSPVLLVAIIAISVFVSNMVVLMVLPSVDPLHHSLHYLVDFSLLIALISPPLILLVHRPIELQIARRRRIEKKLSAEHNKFMGILDAMPGGASIVNRFHQIEYTNSALVEEFGPVNGRNCHEYFQGSTETCPNCKLTEILKGRESVTREAVCGKTGQIYEVFETPLQNDNGCVSKLAIVHNISVRHDLEKKLRSSRQSLRSLSAHQLQVREQERTSISREIHDELGQILATVQLGVSSLAEEYHDHRHLTEKITAVERLLSSGMRTVRRIATELRPAILDDLGLAEAVEWQVAEFRTATGIDCTPDILLVGTNFNREVATAVFRICQEALTNVIRHSGATRVAVSLEERNGRIVFIIADNGCGIPPEALRENRSLGITGMRERAYSVGGRVRLCRSSRQSTIVIAHIPLNPPGGETCPEER